jgi:hypothetical protein
MMQTTQGCPEKCSYPPGASDMAFYLSFSILEGGKSKEFVHLLFHIEHLPGPARGLSVIQLRTQLSLDILLPFLCLFTFLA